MTDDDRQRLDRIAFIVRRTAVVLAIAISAAVAWAVEDRLRIFETGEVIPVIGFMAAYAVTYYLLTLVLGLKRRTPPL